MLLQTSERPVDAARSSGLLDGPCESSSGPRSPPCPSDHHVHTQSASTSLNPRGFAPRTPLHALSRAASTARFRLRAKRYGETSPKPWRRRANRVARSHCSLASWSERTRFMRRLLASSWEHRRVASGRYPRMRRIPPSELTAMRCTRGRGPGRAVELRTLPS